MRLRVQGGEPLTGMYRPTGSSNAAVALIAAALLTDELVTLHNVPNTASTRAMIELAGRIGGALDVQPGGTVQFSSPQIIRRTLDRADVNGLVSSLLFIAPILARRQYVRAEIDFPLNRVRTHLEALHDLGIEVIATEGAIECRASAWGKRDVILLQSSVTATEIVMMLAACLGQETIVHNAACEPHVQELGALLVSMGARIDGIGSNVLKIFGSPTLAGAEATIGPDHIEAASVAAFIALSGGRAQIDGVRGGDLRMIDKIYRRIGIALDIDSTLIFVPRHDQLEVSTRDEDVDGAIETAPWPGFPSDLIATATVVATQTRGTLLIHEKLFNNRLIFIDKLNAMGAQIVLCDPHRAIVVGPTPLRSIYMDSPDVRAGLGMLGAALIAQGESVIDNAQVLGNSFENVVQKFQALGAQITIE